MSWGYVLPRRVSRLVIPPQTSRTDSEFIRREFEVWFEGLPATFQPTTRIQSSRKMTLDHQDLDQASDRDQVSNRSFDEIWYTNGMVCFI